MKRTFLFISGLHRDMVGVTMWNIRHDQIKILIKHSLTSVLSLHGTVICYHAKNKDLASINGVFPKLCVSTTTKWFLCDNVTFRFFFSLKKKL